MCLCASGLSSESETGLVETDTDSHRPLMSDEEDELEAEAYSRRYQSVQEPDEPLTETPRAIGFCEAFCLPGVLPVSPPHQQVETNLFTFQQTYMLTLCLFVL